MSALHQLQRAWMALEKFSGKVNDPWLNWDDAILRGAVGAEGLDQLVSFLVCSCLHGRVWQARWSLLPV
jgi:hypothetical protein